MLRTTNILRLATAIAVAASVSWSAHASLGMSPALIQFEDIQLGREIDLLGNSTTTFQVHNMSEAPQAYTCLVEKPAANDAFELGYEPIPDASWCRIDKNVHEVPANSVGKFKLFINVPNKPEYNNRKWMAYVVCVPGKQAPAGGTVGLRLAARVQLETVSKVGAPLEGAGNFAMVPSVVTANADAGSDFDSVVKVRNNTDKEKTYTIKRLDESVIDPEKQTRYIGNGFTPVIKQHWSALENSFTLKPGEGKDLKVDVKIPATAEAGKKHEEVLFVYDDKKCVNFLRVRVEIPKPAAVK